MKIIEGGLSTPQVAALLQQHLEEMALNSPPDSIHALDLDALRSPEVTFFSMWQEDQLMGCGAIKEIDNSNTEIESMRTTQQFLRQGVATRLLTHLIDCSIERGYQQLWLETGSADAFKPARVLYEHFGFTLCDPFASYTFDPYSVFMTKQLTH